MKSKLYFRTIEEIRRLGRKVVLFGAGRLARELVRSLDQLIVAIVDNNPNMIGAREDAFTVESPDRLLNSPDKTVYYVICTTSFTDVGEQLEGYGLSVGKDFCASPSLIGLQPVVSLQTVKRKLLLTSGFRPSEQPLSGGGLYLVEIDGLDFSYRKVHSGTCHGLLQKDGLIFCVDQSQGIMLFDHDFHIKKTYDIEPGQRPHGIDWCEATGEFFVAASHQDCILVFDQNFHEVARVWISEKFRRSGVPVHHINDVCVIGNSVYATMFSFTGNYHQDVFDGVVVEIDAATRSIIGPVLSKLWMPHNPKVFNNGLCVCDSLPGYLRRNNGQIAGAFPAFTRGLASDDEYFYVGQSRNRNFSNVIGMSKNISLDTAIVVFDDKTKLSRTIPLSPRLSEVHAIEVVG